MEVHGYVLERIPKLRCISITEIVFGALGVLGGISNLFQARSNQAGGSIGSMAGSVLLLATGVYGVIIIKRVRQGIVDSNSFRILGILNMVLCILWALGLVFFIIIAILLAAAPGIASEMLAALGTPGMAAQTQYVYDPYGSSDYTTVATVATIAVVFLVIVIIVTALFIAMAAIAAKISRRNAAIINAGARGAVAGYPMAPPGYTQYSVVKTEHP